MKKKTATHENPSPNKKSKDLHGTKMNAKKEGSSIASSSSSTKQNDKSISTSVSASSASSSASSLKRKKSGDGSSKSSTGEKSSRKSSCGGVDMIDSLFATKKNIDRQKEKDEAALKEEKKRQRKRMKEMMKDDDMIGRGDFSTGVIPNNTLRDNEWADDGLGGRYNNEGYTGRVEDGCKIFKAHILNRPGAGMTKDCPFDCNCCFI